MLLQEEEPAAEKEKRLAGPDAERVTQSFYTTIYGGAANVAMGSQNVTQIQALPAPYDTAGLINYLRQQGVNDKMLDELQDALRMDAKEDHSSESPGKRVWGWLKKYSTASVTGVGVPVAIDVIKQAILSHFGIKP